MEGGGEMEREGGLYSVTYFKLAAQFRCRFQNHNPAFALETLALFMKTVEWLYH